MARILKPPNKKLKSSEKEQELRKIAKKKTKSSPVALSEWAREWRSTGIVWEAKG